MGKSLPFAIEHDSMPKGGKVSKTSDQGKMFIEAARELGCDEDESHFDEKPGKIAQYKLPESKPRKTSNKPRSK
jgi:hypothetical protein